MCPYKGHTQRRSMCYNARVPDCGHATYHTTRNGHQLSRRTYKFRLVTTPSQQQSLLWTLDRCRELYNAALQERKDAYHMAHKSLNYYHQANQLPEVKQAR